MRQEKRRRPSNPDSHELLDNAEGKLGDGEPLICLGPFQAGNEKVQGGDTIQNLVIELLRGGEAVSGRNQNGREGEGEVLENVGHVVGYQGLLLVVGALKPQDCLDKLAEGAQNLLVQG